MYELCLHGLLLIQDKRSERIDRCSSIGNVDVEIISGSKRSIAAKHFVKAKKAFGVWKAG